MIIRLFFALIILLFNIGKVVSQDNIDDSYKAYLHDGKAGTNGNVIKFNLLALACGDVGLHYERKINRAFSIDAGGFIMPYNALRWDLFSYLSDLKIAKPGYGFSIQPRFYLFRGAVNNGPYVGLTYKMRYYELKLIDYNNTGQTYYGQVPLQNIICSAGIQIQKGKRLLWDLSAGYSYLWYKKTSEPIFKNFLSGEHKTKDDIFNINVKLGILL